MASLCHSIENFLKFSFAKSPHLIFWWCTWIIFLGKLRLNGTNAIDMNFMYKWIYAACFYVNNRKFLRSIWSIIQVVNYRVGLCDDDVAKKFSSYMHNYLKIPELWLWMQLPTWKSPIAGAERQTHTLIMHLLLQRLCKARKARQRLGYWAVKSIFVLIGCN